MNIKKISSYCIIILAIAAMSYSLPIGFDKVFGQKIGNPLLFFSPVLEQFVYRESLGGHQFNYKDEDGKDNLLMIDVLKLHLGIQFLK